MIHDLWICGSVASSCPTVSIAFTGCLGAIPPYVPHIYSIPEVLVGRLVGAHKVAVEEGQSPDKPHEEEAKPHESQGRGHIHQSLAPCAVVAIRDKLVMADEELCEAAANDIEAEDSRSEDKEEEGAIVALRRGAVRDQSS